MNKFVAIFLFITLGIALQTLVAGAISVGFSDLGINKNTEDKKKLKIVEIILISFSATFIILFITSLSFEWMTIYK